MQARQEIATPISRWLVCYHMVLAECAHVQGGSRVLSARVLLLCLLHTAGAIWSICQVPQDSQQSVQPAHNHHVQHCEQRVHYLNKRMLE